MFKKPIAHRGLFDNLSGIPENSLVAFEKAVEKGYPFETDVVVLKCGTPVLFHDKNLVRMTGDKRIITECSYNEIKNLSLLGIAPIPTFEEMLHLVSGRVSIMVEIKNIGEVGKPEKIIAEVLGEYEGCFTVHSSNQDSVLWFSKNMPEVTRGVGIKDCSDGNIRSAILHSKAEFLVLKYNSLKKEKVFRYRDIGIESFAYTITNRDDGADALNFCDNIIFEGYIP